jgi:hypothetical protein
MGPASAYNAVLNSIQNDISYLLDYHGSDIFSFAKLEDGIVEIRDFQTTGVVSFARGCPFYNMRTGKLDVGGHRVRVNADYKDHCIEAINQIVSKL